MAKRYGDNLSGRESTGHDPWPRLKHRRLSVAAAVLLVRGFVGGTTVSCADETPGDSKNRGQEKSLPNLFETLQQVAGQTLGGRQFWSDIHFFSGWRIQKNSFTSRYRLLDPEDRRQASGTREECLQTLQKIREKRQLPTMRGRAVILIHGLIRSSRSFQSMAGTLKKGNCTIVRFDYPSTRNSIPESAACLDQVIRSLEGIETIDFVVYSMGGLILRSYLQRGTDPRIRRAVLLGVPNRGARLADRLHGNAVYRFLYGPAGQQLTSDPAGLISSLPVPEFEFGVIAGGRGSLRGFNPMLPGDNDGTVAVRSAKLAGATDYLLVPTIHSFLMTDPRCVAAVRNFLLHGQFEANRRPQPIATNTASAVD